MLFFIQWFIVKEQCSKERKINSKIEKEKSPLLEVLNQLQENNYGSEEASEERWETEGSALFDQVDENIEGPSLI